MMDVYLEIDLASSRERAQNSFSALVTLLVCSSEFKTWGTVVDGDADFGLN